MIQFTKSWHAATVYKIVEHDNREGIHHSGSLRYAYVGGKES